MKIIIDKLMESLGYGKFGGGYISVDRGPIKLLLAKIGIGILLLVLLAGVIYPSHMKRCKDAGYSEQQCEFFW